MTILNNDDGIISLGSIFKSKKKVTTQVKKEMSQNTKVTSLIFPLSKARHVE